MKKAINKNDAKFVIDIRYMQHGSWQGIVKWLDSEEEMCFRSVLELMKILDSVQAQANVGSNTDSEFETNRKVVNLV